MNSENNLINGLCKMRQKRGLLVCVSFYMIHWSRFNHSFHPHTFFSYLLTRPIMMKNWIWSSVLLVDRDLVLLVVDVAKIQRSESVLFDGFSLGFQAPITITENVVAIYSDAELFLSQFLTTGLIQQLTFLLSTLHCYLLAF